MTLQQDVGFHVLGNLEIVVDGRDIDVGGQSRTVLAMLLVAAGRVVTVDSLLDGVWGDDPPRSATGTLQSYVSRLRRILEPDRGRGDAPSVLVWDPPGYRLDVAPEQVDFRRFEALADEGRALLDAGDAAAARTVLADALDLWRGPALLEFADHDFARGLAVRLEQRRLVALEDRIAADLRLGRHAAVVAELNELVTAHPLQEGLRAHLALALYRSGRQAEALRTIADARHVLREELGMQPGPRLRELESAILEQDSRLNLPTDGWDAAATPRRGFSAPVASRGPSLVGRTTELRRLLAALDEAGSSSRVVLIEGDPGVGKTRLAEELTTEAARRDMLAVWGRSYEGGAAPAFWPWLAALRALFDELPTSASMPPELANLLAPADAPDAGAAVGSARFRLFEAIATFLVGVATARRVVIILDDVQWADQASLELIGFLARSLSRPGVVLVCLVRELEAGRSDAVVEALAAASRRPGTVRLRLSGLHERETAQLLEQTAGRPVPAAVATSIHVRADGNPFFAMELARLLTADAELGPVAVGVDVPAGVRDVVRRRLASLPRVTLELLQLAAVIGRDVDLGLLTRAAARPVESCIDDLEPAVIDRILSPVADRPSTFRFSHALVRETLVDDLSPLRRARHHLRVADALVEAAGGEDALEILAEHLWAAVPIGVSERAAAALEAAAEIALRRLAYESAENLLERAVQLRRAQTGAGAAEAELSAVRRLVAVKRAVHGYAAVGDLVERAKQLAHRCERMDVLVDLLWTEWADADTACDWNRSEPIAAQLLDLGRAGDDPRLRMVGHGVWGIHNWHRGRMTDACYHLDAGAEIAAGLAVPETPLGFDLEVRLLADVFRLYVHEMVGDLPDVSSAFTALLERQGGGFPAAIVAGFACVSAQAVGDWHRMERFAREGLAADPNVSFTFWSTVFQMSLANARLNLGTADDESVALFEGALSRYRAAGLCTSRSAYLSTFALGLARVERPDAVTAVARAYEELEGSGERCFEPLVLLADAVVRHATEGQREEAAELFQRSHDVAREQGSHALARRAATTARELRLIVT